MQTQNELNIPAFQRKKSLIAKAKKLSKKTPRLRKKDKTSTLPDVSNITIESHQSHSDYTKDKSKIYKKETKEMIICGICEGYFEGIDVAVIKVLKPITLGEEIIFETSNGLFIQNIVNMQQNRKDIELAKTGSEIGIKVALAPKVGGNIYKNI